MNNAGEDDEGELYLTGGQYPNISASTARAEYEPAVFMTVRRPPPSLSLIVWGRGRAPREAYLVIARDMGEKRGG